MVNHSSGIKLQSLSCHNRPLTYQTFATIVKLEQFFMLLRPTFLSRKNKRVVVVGAAKLRLIIIAFALNCCRFMQSNGLLCKISHVVKRLSLRRRRVKVGGRMSTF